MRKTLYTLQVNGYSERITRLTFPLIKYWASKIGAEFHVIRDRKFPDWPITYEKLQIHELGRLHGNDWNIFLDADTLVHPHMFDPTVFLKKDTVAHNGHDFAPVRWQYDEYFLRDGRNIGSGNWIAIASDWCLDFWRPLDIGPEEAIAKIYPIVEELRGGCLADHLVDDYAMSRNIARYGLKFKGVLDIQKEIGWTGEWGGFMHLYNISEAEKVEKIMEELDKWKIPAAIRQYGE